MLALFSKVVHAFQFSEETFFTGQTRGTSALFLVGVLPLSRPGSTLESPGTLCAVNLVGGSSLSL